MLRPSRPILTTSLPAARVATARGSKALAAAALASALVGCTHTNTGPAKTADPEGKEDRPLLPSILQTAPLEVSRVLEHAEEHRVQILYTQIDRDASNRPRFTSHGYRLDDPRYFYPASTVKLPVAALALERLHDLAIDGLDRDTPMLTGAARPAQTAVERDATSASGLPSVGHYVRKILLVSDNDAYNRLFELLGADAIERALTEKGLRETRIVRRLSVPLPPEENRWTNPVRFEVEGRVLHETTAARSDGGGVLELPDVRQGRGHYAGGEYVDEPIDFRHSNHFPLREQQAVLRALLFPESVGEAERFRLTSDDRRLLLRHLALLPRESRSPRYDDPTEHYDSYVKFFLYGDRRDPIPESVRIFNKVGQAYGYLLDNAYVVDFEHGVEFLLTAVVQVNANGIYNDDTYEYDELGFPFLGALGRAIYDHELDRTRERRPDLSRFEALFGNRSGSDP